MALVLKDRVKETSTTAGTGALTLLGPDVGYQSFAVVGDGNTCYYTIQNTDSGFEGEWEVGLGTYTAAGNTLSRDVVFSSSNSSLLVPFSAGTKTVFLTYPAERSVALNDVTVGLSESDIPFADVDGFIDTDPAFQYSAALHQAKAPIFYSINGIAIYSNSIAYNYAIPSNSTAISYSPISILPAVSLTIPAGQSWHVFPQI